MRLPSGCASPVLYAVMANTSRRALKRNGASVGCPVAIGSGRLQVDRRGLTSAVGFELVGDALVLIERAHPGALDRRDMHEGVRPARFGRDEAVALVGVEEFYSSGGHGCILCRSEEHTSELQSLMRISYAGFCCKKK